MVNGRPILTVEVVKSWLPMSDHSAARIARALNRRAFEAPFYAEPLTSNPSAQRIRRIHDGLNALSEDLRQYLDEQRAFAREISPEIEEFLAQAIAIAPRFTTDGLPPVGPGAPRDRTLGFAQELSRVLEEIYQQENPRKRLKKKQLDGFVTKAAAWLGISTNDKAIGKRRTRSGQ